MDEERHRRHHDEHDRCQRVDAQGPGGDELAGGEPIAEQNVSVRPAGNHHERDPRQDERNAEQAGRDVFGAARSYPRPENAGDQESEKRQEDDQFVHESVSALQRIDVFDRNRAAIAVVGDQDREADRRLRCGDREDEE